MQPRNPKSASLITVLLVAVFLVPVAGCGVEDIGDAAFAGVLSFIQNGVMTSLTNIVFGNLPGFVGGTAPAEMTGMTGGDGGGDHGGHGG